MLGLGKNTEKKSTPAAIKSGLKWLCAKNAEGERGYVVIYRETAGCLRWLFQENAQGVRGVRPAAAALKTGFLSKKFAVLALGAVLTGSLGGAGLSVKLAMRDIRNERLDQMFTRIETGDRSRADRPFSAKLMAAEVGNDVQAAWRNAAIAPYAMRGAAAAFMLCFFAVGAKTVRARFQESRDAPAP